MATNRQLKIEFLKDQNECSRKIRKVLYELSQADAQAYLLPLEESIASRILVKKLWDALPDEQDSYQFGSIEEQINMGRTYLPTNDFKQKVTLHLGWDVLSFSCSLEAAWQSWKNFHSYNEETYNCCIYPESLAWYIARAGENLYPMYYSGECFELVKSGQDTTL